MRREIAGKRYAEAAFQVAREQGTIARWRTDLQAIAGVFAEPEVLGLLESPKVPESAKEGVLSRTLTGSSPQAMNLARLLIQRRRVALAPQVAEDFGAMADDYLGI